MEIKRISNGEIPPEGKYILIYVGHRCWGDDDDPENFRWKVAKVRRKDIHYNTLLNPPDPFPFYFDELGLDRYDRLRDGIDMWAELPGKNKEPGALNDVTEKYANMIEAFECDFSLATEPDTKYGLDGLQVKIEKGDGRLLTDIELLQELSYKIRQGSIKIIEQAEKETEMVLPLEALWGKMEKGGGKP